MNRKNKLFSGALAVLGSLRSLFVAGLLAATVSSALAADNLTISAGKLKAGETKTVYVALDNAQTYTAFQLEIVLPTGVSIVENSVKLATVATSSHQLLSNETETGHVRVVAYSFDIDNNKGNEAFTANGQVLEFQVTAASGYNGDETINIKDILFVRQSDLEGVDMALAGTLGDVNGDGDIDLKDALMIVLHYLGKNPAGFNAALADVTSDETIDLKDALQIVKIYLGK